MRILFLLPGLPIPETSGAAIRNAGLLRLASRSHEVHVLSFGPSPGDPQLSEMVVTVTTVPRPLSRSPATRIAQLVAADRPDMICRFQSIPMRRALDWLLTRQPFDVIQAEGLEMSQYLEHSRAATMPVYDAHNAEFLLQRRAFFDAAQRRRPLAALYSLAQWHHLLRFERMIVLQARLTFAVSQQDANQLDALAAGRRRIEVIPNGVDVGSYSPRRHRGEDAPNVLFIGKLDFRPNADAVRWMLSSILPRLHRSIPLTRFFVVGDCPPQWLIRAGQQDARIVVTGAVSDERPYLQRASAMVIPLRVGGGSRLKALVGFASRLPLVATALALEGLDVEPGTEAVVANDPEAMARELAVLLTDPARRQRLADSAFRLVAQNYDWPRIAPALGRAYNQLAQTTSG